MAIKEQVERAASAFVRLGESKFFHYVKIVAPFILLAFLFYCVARIGVGRVWAARPHSAIFYLIILLNYFVQPITDLIVYRRLWGVGDRLRFRAVLRKQVLNTLIFDYSGEFYFYSWAHRNLGLTRKVILHAIKDCNVLSAVVGLAMAFIVLIVLLVTGQFSLQHGVPGNLWAWLATGLLPFIALLVILVGGRRATTLTRGEIGSTMSIYFARSIVFVILGISAWWSSGALPSLVTCVEFVTLRFVISRLPLMVNKDLVFIGAAMTTASMLNLRLPHVTSVLVLTTGIEQSLGLAVVAVPWLVEHLGGWLPISRGSRALKETVH